MIKRIAHFADIHLKDYKTDKEYREVFSRVYESLREERVDRIVVAGDLFHTKNNVRNEAKILARDFLNSLSEFAPVRVINGNHDGNPNNKEQLNSLKTLIDLIGNDKVRYYDKSTGYVDENVQWMVWDYFDEQNPYQNSVIDESLTQIDLYHNPVNDCSFFNGGLNKGGFSIDNFKGKYFLLGDIHKRQHFTNSKGSKGAYPGSLIQQNFGENLYPHGYLIWDLDKDDFTEVNIPNDYCFQTLRITSNDMVEKMKSDAIDVNFKHINLRVIWEEKQGNINVEEERKLRKKIDSLWGNKIDKLKIIKNPIKETFGDILEDNREIEKEIDVTNTSSLEAIMRLYLKENGWDDDKIEQIIYLDKTVSDSLVWEYNSIQWKLKKLEIENYRSHGDKFTLDLSDKTGLFQIKGLNEQGKTNLLSSIMYLLYGKTLETKKKEKNGDLRFINNKTSKDFCRVAGVLDINGDEFELERITERKWNRGKTEISSCSTKFNWKCNSVSENDENRVKSQKILESAIGSFEDFLRASFITADSLNGLLSQDEAEFLDALLRDSGMEIFERKMQAWKLWEKENALFNRNVDIYNEELEIDLKKKLISETQEDVKSLKMSVINKENLLIKESSERDELMKKIKDVPKLKSLDLLDEEIARSADEIQNLNLIREAHEKKLKEIKEFTSEDQETYDKLLVELSEFEEFKLASQDSISKLKDAISAVEMNKTRHLHEIQIAQNEIDSLGRDLENIYKNYDSIVKNIEKENEDLKKSDTCITCLRKKDKDSLKAIDEKIELNKKRISFILETEILNECAAVELRKKEKVEILKDLTFKTPSFDAEIKESDAKIKETEKNFISRFETNRATLSKKQDLDAKREIFKQREVIQVKIDNIDLKIDSIEKDVSLFHKEKAEVLRWKEIEELQKIVTDNIKQIDEKISIINSEINCIKNEISQKELVVLNNYRNEIETSVKLIELQKDYEKQMNIRNGYQNLIHRNGLPKYLLIKLKNNINITLSNLLSSLSFSSGFDDNMYLKMWDNITPDKTMHVLNGSGKQRTFIALALRLALRSINTTCVNDLLFLDELMGKLVENSVEEFTELLEEIKTKISKVFIVEHAYSEFLNPDYILEVKKNENGVSSILF